MNNLPPNTSDRDLEDNLVTDDELEKVTDWYNERETMRGVEYPPFDELSYDEQQKYFDSYHEMVAIRKENS